MLEPKDARFVNSDISRLKKSEHISPGQPTSVSLLPLDSFLFTFLPYQRRKKNQKEITHTFGLCQYEKKKYTKDLKNSPVLEWQSCYRFCIATRGQCDNSFDRLAASFKTSVTRDSVGNVYYLCVKLYDKNLW